MIDIRIAQFADIGMHQTSNIVFSRIRSSVSCTCISKDQYIHDLKMGGSLGLVNRLPCIT